MKEAGSPPLPQTPSGNIESHLEVSSHKEEPGISQKRRGLVPWIIVGLVGFLVIAVALGVGLGVGLTRHKSSISSSKCGPFLSDGVVESLLTLLVLHPRHPRQQILHRMQRCPMESTTTPRYQSWLWGMVTSGCCSRRAPGVFEKRSSPNPQIHGRAISTTL